MDADAPAERPRLAEFVLEERLGGGGFGVVFRAWDEQLLRPVAVKLFAPSPAGTDGESAVDEALREARAAARLNHPNIVAVIRADRTPLTDPLRDLLRRERPWQRFDGSGDGATVGYIVSEFASGGTLRDRFRKRHGPRDDEGGTDRDAAVERPEEEVRFLLPVVEAVGRAHAAGVVHRDIKPGNVVLTGEGVPKLTDFGLSRSAF
ncbi:protein kinase, partial [Alienimonas sp. DA493]|uniref:protein kinase domain-containing protein n=1 Tax=Alienimonas sp. DA493 TaxID=3373605 RepID=UPI00375471E3